MDETVPCRFCGIAITGAAVRAGGVVHAGTTAAHESCVHPPHHAVSEADRWQALQFNHVADILAIV